MTFKISSRLLPTPCCHWLMFFKGYVQKSVMFSIYKALYKEETYPGSQSSSLVDAEVKVSRRAPNANSSKTY